VRCLNGHLGVELGEIRDLEEGVFHHIQILWVLELEGLARLTQLDEVEATLTKTT
jgi:hypothetical protein